MENPYPVGSAGYQIFKAYQKKGADVKRWMKGKMKVEPTEPEVYYALGYAFNRLGMLPVEWLVIWNFDSMVRPHILEAVEPHRLASARLAILAAGGRVSG